MRVLKFLTGHVIYIPDFTYKFQLKTTQVQNCFGPIKGQVIYGQVYQTFKYSSRSSDAQANAFCQSCRDIDILAIVHLAVIHQ